jgi:hypothetical protein
MWSVQCQERRVVVSRLLYLLLLLNTINCVGKITVGTIVNIEGSHQHWRQEAIANRLLLFQC